MKKMQFVHISDSMRVSVLDSEAASDWPYLNVTSLCSGLNTAFFCILQWQGSTAPVLLPSQGAAVEVSVPPQRRNLLPAGCVRFTGGLGQLCGECPCWEIFWTSSLFPAVGKFSPWEWSRLVCSGSRDSPGSVAVRGMNPTGLFLHWGFCSSQSESNS